MSKINIIKLTCVCCQWEFIQMRRTSNSCYTSSSSDNRPIMMSASDLTLVLKKHWDPLELVLLVLLYAGGSVSVVFFLYFFIIITRELRYALSKLKNLKAVERSVINGAQFFFRKNPEVPSFLKASFCTSVNDRLVVG